MVYMYKRLIYPGVFSFFFKILILWLAILKGERVKGQKMAQSDKKFCPSHSVSQEPIPHMIVVFGTYV